MTAEEIQAEDDARAEAYRASLLNRQAYRKALAARLLALDSAPYTALVAGWQPLINLLREGTQNAGNTEDYIDEQHRQTHRTVGPVWRSWD